MITDEEVRKIQETRMTWKDWALILGANFVIYLIVRAIQSTA